MQHADQSKKAARGVDIDHHFFLEPLHQYSRTVIVDCAPAHIDGLDLVGRRGTDRLIVAIADHVVVLDDPPQRRERKQMCDDRRAVLKPNIKDQPITIDAQMERVRPIVKS